MGSSEAPQVDPEQKPELEPIDDAEQDIAWLQIRELHPLSRIPIYRAYPLFCCFLRLCSKQLKAEVDKELVRERIEKVNNHLDDLIKNAEGDKYLGTSFKRDLARKFGISLHHAPTESMKKEAESPGMRLNDSKGRRKGIEQLD